ncbi:MAG: hypothetical protein LBL91_04285 [Lachnospiraceae bacterium]|jgi:REP element-mobilizing transposase RayT|nr:hypothetical protein [Lachnospiraceae bacterium]
MYNPDVHHRKSIRIKEYDYSKNGMYFITICTQNRECILSEIMNGTLSDVVGAHDCAQPKLILTHVGRIAQKELMNTEKINENIMIDNYIIMPNHVHMIVEIYDEKGSP